MTIFFFGGGEEGAVQIVGAVLQKAKKNFFFPAGCVDGDPLRPPWSRPPVYIRKTVFLRATCISFFLSRRQSQQLLSKKYTY